MYMFDEIGKKITCVKQIKNENLKFLPNLFVDLLSPVYPPICEMQLYFWININ